MPKKGKNNGVSPELRTAAIEVGAEEISTQLSKLATLTDPSQPQFAEQFVACLVSIQNELQRMIPGPQESGSVIAQSRQLLVNTMDAIRRLPVIEHMHAGVVVRLQVIAMEQPTEDLATLVSTPVPVFKSLLPRIAHQADSVEIFREILLNLPADRKSQLSQYYDGPLIQDRFSPTTALPPDVMRLWEEIAKLPSAVQVNFSSLTEALLPYEAVFDTAVRQGAFDSIFAKAHQS